MVSLLTPDAVVTKKAKSWNVTKKQETALIIEDPQDKSNFLFCVLQFFGSKDFSFPLLDS